MATPIQRRIASLNANISKNAKRAELVRRNNGSAVVQARISRTMARLHTRLAEAKKLAELAEAVGKPATIVARRSDKPYEVYGINRPAPAHDLAEFDDGVEDIAGFLRENSMSIY